MHKHILYYSFVLIALYGCVAGKSPLSPEQLQWLQPYNEGDTLIFRSEKGEFDTSYIIKKDIHYADANVIETGRYKHQWGKLVYKNKKLQYNNNTDNLVSMVTSDPPEEARLFVSYLYSACGMLKFSAVSQFKKGDVYEFNTYHPQSKPYQPMKIFWHPQKGIFKYISHDNIMWERINLP